MAEFKAPPAAEAAGPRLPPGFSCGSGSGASAAGRALPAGPAGAALPGPGRGEVGGEGSHGAACRAGAAFAGRGGRSGSLRAPQRNETATNPTALPPPPPAENRLLNGL